MARKTRVHFFGALYHVICSGNNRDSIFISDTDKQDYLQQVIRYKTRYNFKLYSYCIMNNTAHLLIQVGNTPLSKIMQGIQQVYTMSYNTRYNNAGHVFGGRYKAVLIDKQNYLLATIKHIHTIPVRKMLNNGLNYTWSSHKHYMNKVNTPTVNVDFPLSLFSSFSDNRVNLYLEYMLTPTSDYANIPEKYLAPKEHLNASTKSKHLIKPLEVTYKVTELTKISLKEIRSKNRHAPTVWARKLLAYSLVMFTDLSRKEVADFVNVSPPTISNIFAKKQVVEELERESRKLRFY